MTSNLRLAPFEQWANQRGVRWLPAKGSTISSYALEVAHRGDAFVLETIAAIERAHFAAGLANPTATPTVWNVVSKIVTVEPPRSWPKNEKAMFALLPPEIKVVIAKREHDREIEIRRSAKQDCRGRQGFNQRRPKQGC